jgi:hypothetical protein
MLASTLNVSIAATIPLPAITVPSEYLGGGGGGGII